MSELAEYELDKNTTVRFEIDQSTGYRQASSKNKVVGKLREAAEPAVRAARTVLDMLEDARPSEAEVTFAVKASGDMNWIVGKAATEGTFQVRLLWKPSEAGADKPARGQSDPAE